MRKIKTLNGFENEQENNSKNKVCNVEVLKYLDQFLFNSVYVK